MLSQDSEALRELVSLSSSQLEEIENSAGDSYEEGDKKEREEREGDEGTFSTGYEHAQFMMNLEDHGDDQVLSWSLEDENSSGGSSRKREHPDIF